MATAYQRIRQRKLYYLIAIVLLLGAAYAHKLLVIDHAVKQYDISETNLGKVDLGGSISRFVLSSFRGPLVCGLWWEVNALQEKHDYRQLELILTALTKLQPHYKGPWKYQAWNLAYNVSVEFDRVEDKYYYISKGLRWLANGEEVNRVRLYDPKSADPEKLRTVGDPEMRAEIAQHLSTKMYYSDEQAFFRPMLHMSCIPFTQRDPVSLRNNPQKLEQFKAQYPRFVRRVRTQTSVPEGDEASLNRELLAFLEEHKDVPSLWKIEDNNSIKLADDPWPRWPNMADRDLLGKVADQELMQDGLDIARNWYEFSTEMLPPPKTQLTEDVAPEEDKYTRVAKSMHSMIFRANPARTESRSAAELYKEGWPEQAQRVAEKGYAMWIELGKACNLEHPASVMASANEKSGRYSVKYREKAERMEPPPEYLKTQNPAEYESALDDYKAFTFLNNLNKLRSTCRYEYWRDYSEMCKSDIFREAAKARYLAEQHYTDWPVAIAYYQRAIGLLTLMIKKPLPMNEEMALRLSLLTPNAGTVLAQVAPAVSIFPSSFGSHDTTYEDLLDLQDNYMRILARNLAPQRMRVEYQTWLMRQALTSGTLAATGQQSLLAPMAYIPTSYLNIDWIEDLIEGERGPFQDVIPEEIRLTRERDKSLTKK